MHHLRRGADQIVHDGLAVDGMIERLAYALVHEPLVLRPAGRVEREIGKAKGPGFFDRQIGRALHALCFVLGDIPDPIDGARHQLGGARIRVFHRAEKNLADLRFTLGAAIPIVLVFDKQNGLARLQFGDLVGPRAI